MRGDTMGELIEKMMCIKCGIVFEKADACPRCGKKDKLEVYFDMAD